MATMNTSPYEIQLNQSPRMLCLGALLLLLAGCGQAPKATDKARQPPDASGAVGKPESTTKPATQAEAPVVVFDVTEFLDRAFLGNSAAVQKAIGAGMDVNAVDEEQRTALMFAASGDNTETVSLLLDAGAEINVVDTDEGFTALMHAAAEGQASVVKILLDHAADPDLRDADGDTAKDFATQNGHAEVVRLLTK
jgi:ankyrin repeat protein